MAFANKNLSVIAYANGFTLWHYAENIELSKICETGFFNSVKTLMNIGDMILINGIDSSAIRRVTATATDVTVAALG